MRKDILVYEKINMSCESEMWWAFQVMKEKYGERKCLWVMCATLYLRPVSEKRKVLRKKIGSVSGGEVLK